MLKRFKKFPEKIKKWIKSKWFIVYLIAVILMTVIKFPFENWSWLGLWFWIIAGFVLISIEVFEKHILKHITIIVFFSIFLFITEPEKVIQYKDLYLLIWWLFAFWYWYKRYERDKELELLEKYWKRYDKLKKEKNYSWILSLCEEEYYLYKKDFLSNDLWNRIQFKIDENLQFILDNISKEFIETSKKQWLDEALEWKNRYIELFFDTDIISSWKWFWDYLINRLLEIKADREKIISWDLNHEIYKSEEMINISKEYITLIDIIVPTMKKAISLNKINFDN
jgi:hypothetical protein